MSDSESDSDSDSDDDYAPQANALVGCAAVAAGAVAAATAAAVVPATASAATASVSTATASANAAAAARIALIANVTPDITQRQVEVTRALIASGSTLSEDAVDKLGIIDGMRVAVGPRPYVPQAPAPPNRIVFCAKKATPYNTANPHLGTGY